MKERFVNLATKIHKGTRRRQMTVEATFNEKLLPGVQGGGFLEKSPLGKEKRDDDK